MNQNAAPPTIDAYRKVLSFSRGEKGGRARSFASSGSGKSSTPLVSIVTVVRNAGLMLERTVQSVLNQSYPSIEYVVIDGGSNDGTLDIIRSYEEKIAFWISEPDNGISDAFNKGIAASHGDFIGLLNADDRLSPGQIEHGVAALLKTGADYVFGNLLFHDAEGRILYRINGDPEYYRVIHSKMPELCHPTVLARREAYERIGLFDTRYRYAMDYEWLLRLHTRGGRGHYASGIVGHMGIGGASDSSFYRAVREVRDISIRYGQGRLKAELLYGYRIVKGAGRRLLERMLPGHLFGPVRRIFNPRFKIGGQNADTGSQG